MSHKLLIEQILMDEQIASENSITMDNVARELKNGVHVILYSKKDKKTGSDIEKKYNVTRDQRIIEELEAAKAKLDTDEDAEETRTGRSPKVRAALNAVHRLITVYDVQAETYKTLKYANIISFDGIPVNHNPESNPVTTAHSDTGDKMYKDYSEKIKGVPGLYSKSLKRGRRLSGIATDTSFDPSRIDINKQAPKRETAQHYRERLKRIKGAQQMLRNRSRNFERDTNETIY